MSTEPKYMVEPDRFLVLLSCGHWLSTSRPGDGEWYCRCARGLVAPAIDGVSGAFAVLQSWEYFDGE